MLSAGPIATSGTGNTTLLACDPGQRLSHIAIVNEGGAPGFVSFDGGATWPVRLSAGPSSVSLPDIVVSAPNGLVLVKRDGGTDMSAILRLGLLSMSDLITTPYAIQNGTLSKLNTSNGAYVSAMITAASDVIQRVCMRTFGPGTYSEYYSGGGYPNQLLELEQYPVTAITRVATHPRPALFIVNNSSSNQRATVATTATGVTLLTMASGIPTTTVLAYANYVTLALLGAAITALGNGWTVRIDPLFSLWPSADLKPLQGAMTTTGTGNGAALDLYTEDVHGASPNESFADIAHSGWRLDPQTGQLYGYFPEGNLNIRVDYQRRRDRGPCRYPNGLSATLCIDGRR